MTTISAKIIADSINGAGNRLTTIHMRYPRFIHAELMTHRVFSRNARSSRAVPVKTMIEEIMTDPVVPLHWGKNQKGMQAEQECNEPVSLYVGPEHGGDSVWPFPREAAWLKARGQAVKMAVNFADAGYHKQIVNRLLEPFMHIDVLVSATEWANFLWLRDHKDAEPHIAMLAREVRAVMDASTPDNLRDSQWHLPYVPHWERADLVKAVTGRDWREDWVEADYLTMIKVSAARCARISYKPFDGTSETDYTAEIARYDLLVGSQPMHASPVEHQATPDRKCDNADEWVAPGLHGNFVGWIQHRKMLKGENHDRD